MRRLISEAKLERIKKLFLSLWTDDAGCVEIGKDLHVDGAISYNGGHKLPEFTHCVTINGGHSFQAKSADNLKCDSYQDLSRLFGGKRYPISNGIFIDLHGGSIATDFIRDATGDRKLSSLSPLTIEDDVFME